MPKRKKPDHISQKAWDAVDSPELTAADFKRMKPASEVMPSALYAEVTRGRGQRGKQKSATKVLTPLRLDADILAAYKAQGRGWQTRMNDALRKAIND